MFLDIDDEEDPDNDTHEPARAPGGRSHCPQWAQPEFDDLEGRQLSSVLPKTSPSAPAIATFKGNKNIACICSDHPGSWGCQSHSPCVAFMRTASARAQRTGRNPSRREREASMWKEPNDSQPVNFLSGQPKLVRAVIRKDDGSCGGPGDISATMILEVRLSSEDFIRAGRAIDSLTRRPASLGRSSPSAKPGTAQSPAAREFPEFALGAGV
jgi:hypothetical protein